MESKVTGVNIGNGFTKAYWAGRKTCFESQVAPAIEVEFYTSERAGGEAREVESNGARWMVGEWARVQNPHALIQPRGRERDLDYLMALTMAALYNVQAPERIAYLTTGLPLQWYRDKERLEAGLVGPHVTTINGHRQRYEIEHVTVMPESLGTFFYLMMDDALQGNKVGLGSKKVLIIDVGTTNTNFVTVNKKTYSAGESTSVDVGMSDVYTAVAAKVLERYGRELSFREAEEAYRERIVRVSGTMHSIGTIVEAAEQAVFRSITAIAKTKYGRGDAFDAIPLTGGGANGLAKRFKALYPQAWLVPQAQMANAMGFYRYSKLQVKMSERKKVRV